MKKNLRLRFVKAIVPLLIFAILLISFVVRANRASGIFASEQQAHFGESIAGVLKWMSAAQQREVEYQAAAWEEFQSSSPGAKDLADARLHVSLAEIDEFTTGENRNARVELDKARSSIKNAESQVDGNLKPKLTALLKEIAAAEADVGKNEPGQQERYLRLEKSLSEIVRGQ